MLGRASLALQWFGPRTWVGAPPRRFSGTTRRPRLWPLRARTTAPAQPPTWSRKAGGGSGSRTAIPARQALVVRPNTALRGGDRTRPPRGGGVRGHALAHSPVTGSRPASPAGLYSRPSPRCAWSRSCVSCRRWRLRQQQRLLQARPNGSRGAAPPPPPPSPRLPPRPTLWPEIPPSPATTGTDVKARPRLGER